MSELEIITSIFSLSNFTVLYDAFRTAIGGVECFVILYFICLACFFVIGKDYMNDGFVYPFFFMALTVFNPFLIVPLSKVIGLLPRIRRLFWLLPVNLVLAFVFTRSVFAPRKKFLRLLTTVCITGIVIYFGSSVIPQLHMPENIWKVSNTVLQISDLIEEDASGNDLEKSALYSDVELLELRQYNPSIHSVLRRNDLLDWSIDPADEEAVSQVIKSKHVLHTLALVSRYGIEIDPVLFVSYMERVKASYVITEPSRDLHDYLTGTGLEQIGEIDGYRIYRLYPDRNENIERI